MIAFEVDRSANKIEIKRAVETQFKVQGRRGARRPRRTARCAGRAASRAAGRTGRRPTSAWRAGEKPIEFFEGDVEATMGIKTETSRPTPRAGSRRTGLRGDHDGAAAQVADRGQERSGGRNNRGQLTVLVPRRRPQAALPRRSTSARQARGPGQGRDASSTTRTARRASPCCTTPTARSATSCGPTASRSAPTVMSGEKAEVNVGNALPLRRIPLGTVIHNIELKQRQGRPDGALAPAPAPS